MSLKKNFIYNAVYQILLIILPFITVPYVSRVLGSDGVGIYSYTYSIVYYFMLISMLGINNYGNRTIAKVKENKLKLSKTFISIYAIQIFMNILMVLLYLLYIKIFDVSYYKIAFIQIIALLSCLFDVNWFFFGLEKFKLTVTRNIVIKILSFGAILLFVKSSDDLWIYTLIMSLSTFISTIILIPFLLKEVTFVKVKFEDIIKNIKPIVILFIPLLAVSLYKIMDKIMLGSMSIINEVGYYEQSEKIINIPMGLITALGTVMLPRISNLVEKGDEIAISNYMDKSINFAMFMASPICFGLMAISNTFIPVFLGDDFYKSSILIYFLAPTILFISFANVIRTQYLIPREKDKIFITSVLGGACINLVLNYILIRKMQSIGACIGTIAAELFVMFYQTYSIRKKIPVKKYLTDSGIYLYKGLIMFLIVFMIGKININIYIKIIMQIFIGAILYAAMNYKYIKSILGGKYGNLKKNQKQVS